MLATVGYYLKELKILRIVIAAILWCYVVAPQSGWCTLVFNKKIAILNRVRFESPVVSLLQARLGFYKLIKKLYNRKCLRDLVSIVCEVIQPRKKFGADKCCNV